MIRLVRNIKYVFELILLATLIFLANKSSLFISLAILAMVILFTVNNIELLLAVVFIYSVLESRLQLFYAVDIPFYSRIIYLYAIALLLYVRHAKVDKSQDNKWILSILLILVIDAVRIIFSGGSLTGIWNIVLALIIASLSNGLIELDKFYKYIFYSFSLIILDVILSLILGNYSITYDSGGGVNGMIMIWEGINSNDFCIRIAIVSIYLLGIGFLYFSKFKIVKFVSVMLYLSSLFIIFRVGSRISFFGCFASGFLVVLQYLKNKGTSPNQIIKIFIGTIITIGSLVYIIPVILNNYPLLKSRFQIATILASHGTSRFDIWKSAVYLISQRPVIGYGYCTDEVVNYMLLTTGRAFNSMHNLLLELLINVGIIGTVVMLGYMIKVLLKCLRLKTLFPRFQIPLYIIICIFLIGLAEGLYTLPIVWLSLGLSSISNSSYDELEATC